MQAELKNPEDESLTEFYIPLTTVFDDHGMIEYYNISATPTRWGSVSYKSTNATQQRPVLHQQDSKYLTYMTSSKMIRIAFKTAIEAKRFKGENRFEVLISDMQGSSRKYVINWNLTVAELATEPEISD